MMPKRKSVIQQVIVLLAVFATLCSSPAVSGSLKGAAEKLVDERLQTDNMDKTAGSTPSTLTVSKPKSIKVDMFSSVSVWSTVDKSEGYFAWRECNGELTCELSVMKKSGATQESMNFVRKLDGEGYLDSFEEKGRVDLGKVTFPIRMNTNEAFVFLNGSPSLVSTELWCKRCQSWGSVDINQDPNYPRLKNQYPNLDLWPAGADFKSAQSNADGGQRFIFSYSLLNGCHGCAVLGWAEIAFDFDRNGVFKGTKLLGLDKEVTIADNDKVLGARPFPVIFIHGIAASAEDTWGPFRDHLHKKLGWIFGGIPTYNKNTKKVSISCPLNSKPTIKPDCTGSYGDFYTVDSPDNQLFSFHVQGGELSAIIQAVLDANPGKGKVILVAHSMGGLAAREYIQGMAGEFDKVRWIQYRNDVDKLITIGTPHQGSAHPFICKDPSMLTQAFCRKAKLNPYASASTELQINSVALQNLNSLVEHPLPEEVSYVSLIGIGTTNKFVFWEDGDGVVTATSQNLGALVPPPKLHYARSIHIKDRADCGTDLIIPLIPPLVFHERHTCEAGDSDVWTAILNAL